MNTRLLAALAVAALVLFGAGCRSEETTGTDCAQEMLLTATDHGPADETVTVIEDPVHVQLLWYNLTTTADGYMRVFVWGENIESCATREKTWTAP